MQADIRRIKILLLSTLLFSLSNCSGPNTTIQESENAKEDLLTALSRFNTAFEEADVEVLQSMITDNYIHTNSSSKAIRKEDWLNYLKKRSESISSEELVITNYEMGEVEIEIHGTTAIVTGKISVSSTTGEGSRDNEYRITNVWVNENGEWKRAGFHDTKIK